MLIVLVSAVIAAWLTMSTVALADGGQPRFPAEHEDFLSAGAHALLFEHDRERTHTAATPPTEIARGDAPLIANIRMNGPQCVPNSAPCVPLGGLGRSETTLAATSDGDRIVGAWNNADGLLRPPFADVLSGAHGVTAYGFSIDGGRTWTDRGAPPAFRAGADSIITASDPWLDRGGKDKSTFYFANLAINDEQDPPPTGQASTGEDGEVVPRGISIHRGHFRDDNFVWDDGHLIEPPHPGDLYDKDAIAMAKDGSGAGYVTISNFLALCGKPAFGFGQVEVWRTQDGGTTWNGPAIAGPDLTFNADHPSAPNCGDGGILQQSSSPAIGPAGEVYVVWQRGPTLTVGAASPTTDIVVARSLSGGVSFEGPVTVSTINSMRQDPPVGFNKTRINDHPRIAVATSGRNAGRVYVTFASAVAPVPAQGQPRLDACPPDVGLTRFLLCVPQSLISTQVFVSHSDDQGRTWSPPTPLAGPVPPTGLKRWWPVVSVEPGGAVGVVYYESQEKAIGTTCDVHMPPLAIDLVHEIGPAVSLVDTFRVRSVDGSLTFGPPSRLSTATSNWCATRSDISANFGDYIGSAAVEGGVLAAWADGRAGVPDAFFAAARGEEGE
jgi:hypothetical protein